MLRHSQTAKYALILSALLFTGCISAHKKSISKSTRASAANTTQRVEPLPALTSDQKIMQELTGKKDVPLFSKAELRKQPLSVQHFYAGQKAGEQKNYIMAIKHYNTVIKKYPRSAEVKKALIAKSQIYKEMGLTEPAQLNMSLAQNKNTLQKKQAAKNAVQSTESQKAETQKTTK